MNAIDGKVHLDLWVAGRKPGDDPFKVELSPGDAMSLVCDLARAAKSALIRQLGGDHR